MENENNDQDQDEAQDTKSIVEAIQYLAQEFDTLKERLGALEEYFHDKFIGGLMQMVNDQNDTLGADDIKTNFGDKLSPFEGLHAQLHGLSGGNPDEDLYTHVYKTVKGIPEGDERNNSIMDIIKQMGSTRDKLLGATGGKPIAGEIKIASENPIEEKGLAPEDKDKGEGEGDEGSLGDLVSQISNMKKSKRYGVNPLER